MNKTLLETKLLKLKDDILALGEHLDLDDKKNKERMLKNTLESNTSWEDITSLASINKEISNLEKLLTDYNDLLKVVNDLIELLPMVDSDELKEIEFSYEELLKKYNKLEITSLLNGQYDNKDCYLEIHPGAGGTEACDWAMMIKRMYTMFCDKNNYHYQIIDEQKGDEAGIKMVSLKISGYYPYGYFKGENGVHRLVRISPFDASARRHTSFASVSVVPVIDETIQVDIKDSDLKIDVYHSSGAGGQSVNTANSAVRITHLPSKIVVSCQVERSQQQNKTIALEMLKSKLYAMKRANLDKKKGELKGDIVDINFGSQIRNYVLEPYKLVKDLRTGYETTNTNKVLDGDILGFMESYLKNK